MAATDCLRKMCQWHLSLPGRTSAGLHIPELPNECFNRVTEVALEVEDLITYMIKGQWNKNQNKCQNGFDLSGLSQPDMAQCLKYSNKTYLLLGTAWSRVCWHCLLEQWWILVDASPFTLSFISSSIFVLPFPILSFSSLYSLALAVETIVETWHIKNK